VGIYGNSVRAPQASPHSAPAQRSGFLASTWLLIAWTGTVGLWILAEALPLKQCPYGQHCARAPLLTSGEKISGWVALWLAGIMILLLVRWRDRQQPRMATVASPRRTRWVLIVLASLAGVLAGAHFLLLAPMVGAPFCAEVIRVNHYMAYPLNCDSREFMALARHPRLLLAHDNTRQSRPGYVALAAVATRIVGPAAASLGLDRTYGQVGTAYIPLILINLIVAATAVALLAWLLGRFGTPIPVVIGLCSLLVLNDLMKAFFWSPHQQMFALLVPLATIAVGRWVILRQPAWPIVAVGGGVLGLASLVYGNMIITVGVLTVILLARGWRGVIPAAMLCVMFSLAPVAWIWLCRGLSGSYYNQETARYREFIWLPEAMGQGWHALWTRLELASVGSVRELLGADALVLGVLAGFVLAAICAGTRLTAGSSEESAILVASGLTIACSLLFGWGIGILATRIMYCVLPGILVAAGWAATRFAVKSRATLLVSSYGLALIAIANALHEIMTHGPYS
jgi:hypothetical protein